MLPDSTVRSKKDRGSNHDSPDSSRRRKKKKNDEKRKTKKHRSSPRSSSSRSSSPSSSSSSDNSPSPKSSPNAKGDSSLMNLKEKIVPLFSIINDREQLIQELFRSIHGKRLATMLPEYLKDIPLEELKSRCREQLEHMSTKRIESILRGEPVESSSDDEEGAKAEEGTDRRKTKMTPPDSTSHLQTEDSCSQEERIPASEPAAAAARVWRGQESEVQPDSVVRGGEEEVSPCDRLDIYEEAAEWESEDDDESESSEAVAASGVATRAGEDESKTKTEIFELEMRARAIRAMLKAQELKERRSRRRKETK